MFAYHMLLGGKSRRVFLLLSVAVSGSVLAGCGGGSGDSPPLMPAVEGLRLDVAISDLSAQGVDEEDVEVVGGGTLGVLDESNWDVCEQRPAAGTAIQDVRLIVDRVCGEGDSSTPPEESDEEVQDEPESDQPATEESDGTVASNESGGADSGADVSDPMSPVQFAVSARGDIADLRKDLGDSFDALTDGSFLRLTSNYLEMAFNQGQLESLDPPEKVKSEWNSALKELESAMDSYSDALDGDSLNGVSEALAQIDAALNTLAGIAESVA